MEPVRSAKSIQENLDTIESHRSDKKVDLEKDVDVSSTQEVSSDDASGSGKPGIWAKIKSRCPWYKTAFHVFWACFFTSWWLSIVIQDKHRHKWLIPTILWGCIMVRFITWHYPVMHKLLWLASIPWNFACNIIYNKLFPKKWQRLIAGATVVVATVLVGTFVPTETPYSRREDRAVSFFGVVVAIALLYITSKDRSKVNWNTVIGGMLMQFIIALFVLRTKAGYDIFNFISTLARELLGFARDGVAFLTNADVANLPYFFFGVLPAVAFFVAFVHIWYYFGVIQWAIGKFATFFFWSLRVSGAEAIVTAASPFIGQGESAVLIKDLLPYLTKAEMHQVMCAGFATISGSVLVGYIGLGLNPQALVSSCVMSIPCSLAVSKLRYPETEEPLTAGKVYFPKKDEKDTPKNVILAFANGAALGLRIVGSLMIQIMCIIALVALVNALLTWFGNFWNINKLTLDLMLSYLLYPVGFLLGTPRNEILHVSRLIAIKTISNEYAAYELLTTKSPYTEMSDRGTLIATYALCGFSNFGSIGITIGVLGAICPGRAKDISSTIISAFISGAISTLISAAIAGMVIHDLEGFLQKH